MNEAPEQPSTSTLLAHHRRIGHWILGAGLVSAASVLATAVLGALDGDPAEGAWELAGIVAMLGTLIVLPIGAFLALRHRWLRRALSDAPWRRALFRTELDQDRRWGPPYVVRRNPTAIVDLVGADGAPIGIFRTSSLGAFWRFSRRPRGEIWFLAGRRGELFLNLPRTRALYRGVPPRSERQRRRWRRALGIFDLT
jgi:hypothetical protein